MQLCTLYSLWLGCLVSVAVNNLPGRLVHFVRILFLIQFFLSCASLAGSIRAYGQLLAAVPAGGDGAGSDEEGEEEEEEEEEGGSLIGTVQSK